MQNQVFTLYSEEYHMLLRFNPQQESFAIHVQNKHTNQIYYQTVDSEFLQRENVGCNADATDFFNYLCNNQEVSFENGTLRFIYVWGKPVKKERKIQIALIRDQVSYLKNELRVAHDQIKRLYYLNAYNTRFDEKQKLSIDLQKIIDSHPKCDNRNYFSTMRQGPNSYVTTIKLLPNYKKKQDEKYYNFINKSAIMPNMSVTYSIILSDYSQQIMLGLCTKSGPNQYQDAYKQEQTFYYDLFNECIWMYGTKRLNFKARAKLGDVVLIKVDYVKNYLVEGVKRKISFWKNGIELKSINYCRYQQVEKDLYFSVLMINPNDQIQVSALIIKENDKDQVNSK